MINNNKDLRLKLISKVLNNEINNNYCLIGQIKNGNYIILKNNRLEIISIRTNNFLGYCNIKQLDKYYNKINWIINNSFLYYLSESVLINKHNMQVEENLI